MRTARLTALAVLVVAIASAAIVLLVWTIDEEHFDRPSAAFDAFEKEIEGLPGVISVDTERWVEAPTFARPTSWMSVEVDEEGLPHLLDVACSHGDPDPVSWSIHVRTPSGAAVSMHSTPRASPPTASSALCPDFGFDALRVADALDRAAPGLAVQPAVWENGRFALVPLSDETIHELLPLLEHIDDIRAAAELDEAEAVDIDGANLSVTIRSGEGGAYLGLLADLVEDHAVTALWAARAETQHDGVARVQITAPAAHRAAIEEALHASGLPIADLPVQFLEE